MREAERHEQGITEAEAEELLYRDVKAAENAVLGFIDVPLTYGQFDALGVAGWTVVERID